MACSLQPLYKGLQTQAAKGRLILLLERQAGGNLEALDDFATENIHHVAGHNDPRATAG